MGLGPLGLGSMGLGSVRLGSVGLGSLGLKAKWVCVRVPQTRKALVVKMNAQLDRLQDLKKALGFFLFFFHFWHSQLDRLEAAKKRFCLLFPVPFEFFFQIFAPTHMHTHITTSTVKEPIL